MASRAFYSGFSKRGQASCFQSKQFSFGSLRFWIPILLQLDGRYRYLNTIGRNVDLGNPEQRIEDHFAEIVVTEVPVVMTATKARSTASLWPLPNPGQTLRLADL